MLIIYLRHMKIAKAMFPTICRETETTKDEYFFVSQVSRYLKIRNHLASTNCHKFIVLAFMA